jgi:TolA-binding protein
VPTQRPIRFLAAALLLAALATPQAHAVNKDMVQLQTQIQDLQNAVAKLQQSNDERMGVLKDLVQQTADSVNKMAVAIDAMKLQTQNQQEAAATKSDQLSGQIQSLNDTLDELKARMARLDKATSDIQGQLTTISGALNNLPQSTGTPAAQPTTTPDSNPNPPAAAPADATLPPTAAVIAPTRPAPSTGAGPSAAPIGDLYRTAYGDYNSAKYPLATSEFMEMAQAYPDDNLSGNAYFYMGEIDLRTQKPTAAVRMYDHLIEHFPDNVKIPAAHLHKADAMIAMKQNPAAARELQALIQRFPNSPEATAARSKLAALNARR